MSRIRTVGGTITKTTKRAHHMYSEGSIVFNSGKTITEVGEENGIIFAEPKDAPKKEGVKESVKEIELLTPLDDGSANDQSGGLQKGMIFGKTYQFKIKSYTKEAPKDKSIIKWMLKYHSLSQNKWIEIPLSLKGDTVKITMNDEDMCGRFAYIRAYINDSETEGELKVWKHNRFRWFDRNQLKQEIEDRIINSSLIDQGGSSMCGIAVVGFNFAREQGEAYRNFVLDIHRMGKAKNQLTGYELLIDQDEHLLKYKLTDARYPSDSTSVKKMAVADFIFLICIKDNLNLIFDYDPDGANAGGLVEGGTGLTLPNEVASIMRNIANYQDVINDTNLITSRTRGASIWAKKLQDKLNQGYRIGLLIDSDNFSKNKKSTFTVPTHWVGLININSNDTTELVDVEVYTWGGTRKWILSYDVFKDGYFGYIAGK